MRVKIEISDPEWSVVAKQFKSAGFKDIDANELELYVKYDPGPRLIADFMVRGMPLSGDSMSQDQTERYIQLVVEKVKSAHDQGPGQDDMHCDCGNWDSDVGIAGVNLVVDAPISKLRPQGVVRKNDYTPITW